MKTILRSIIATILLCSAVAWSAERDAVVKLSTKCSGVCVTKDGLVISAKHCGTPKNVTVEFPGGRKVKAKLVHTPKGWDGCVVYHCEIGEYPFAPVSSRRPMTGDKVHSIGYPGKDSENLISMKGLLTGATVVRERGLGRKTRNIQVNTVDFQMLFGMSGGPLFNNAGEVMGILSTSSPTDSQFIQLKDIRASLATATKTPVQGKHVLYAFVGPGGT